MERIGETSNTPASSKSWLTVIQVADHGPRAIRCLREEAWSTSTAGSNYFKDHSPSTAREV